MIKRLLNLNKSTRIITILLTTLLLLPQSTLAEETSFKDNLGGTWYDSDDSNATPIGPSASYTIAAGQKLEIFSSASGYPQSESSIGYYVMKSIRFAIQQTYTSSQITVTLSQPSIAGGSDYTVIGGLNQSDQVFSWSLNEYYPTGIDLKQDQRLKLIIQNNSETESIPLTISSIEIVPIYDITIAGTEVDGDNASNIFAGGENDGKVSFTPATGDTPATLTLNGANIEGGVSCNLDALTIHLSGDNSLESIEGGGSLTFSGENNATLSLNFSDGIMRGFSSVDFGGYNLLSNSSPDVHYDDTDHRLVDYNSDNVADLTLTKKTIYPIWVYDDAGSDFNFKQITEDNKTNVLGDDYSSVSFDGNNTLNLKGAQIAHTFYDSFIIGVSLNNLTIHLVGYNEIGGSDRNAFKFLGNNTTLSFTTSETLPGCLVTYGSLSHGQKEDIIYANSLSYNASDKKVCVPTANNTTTTYITGPTSVINPQDGVVYMYTNPSAYYASSATLTDRSGHAPTYIKVSSSTAGSTNTAALWPTSFPSSQTINKVTLQFDWGTCSNKDVTVQIKGIEEKTGENTTWVDNGEIYSGDEPISLSRANADGILEIPLTSAITSENIQLYFSSSQSFSIVPLSVSLKTGETATLKFEGLSDNYVRTVYGEDFTKPTLTNSNNLTLTYSSDDNSIATVDKDNGDINIVGLGTVMISVTGIDPTGVYVPATAYYDLSVNLAAPTLTPESGVYFLNDGKFTVTASTTNKLPAGYAQEDFTIEMAVDNGSSSNKSSHDFTTTGSHSIMARSFIDKPDSQMPIEL